jgi:uncharacterized protein
MSVFVKTALTCLSIVSIAQLKADMSEESVKEFLETKENALKGDVESQYHLGLLLWLGHGIPFPRNDLSVQWYKKAAEQGHAAAQCSLAEALWHGRGCRPDQTAAINWYTKAALNGNPEAQYELGEIYFNGLHVKMDVRKGFLWYLKSAEQGNTLAQYQVGIAFSQGIGTVKNETEAYAWLNVAGSDFADARNARDRIEKTLPLSARNKAQRRSVEIHGAVAAVKERKDTK